MLARGVLAHLLCLPVVGDEVVGVSAVEANLFLSTMPDVHSCNVFTRTTTEQRFERCPKYTIVSAFLRLGVKNL